VKNTRTHMQRRTFLRGTAASGLTVCLGLPLLEAMLDSHGTALAQGTPLAKRFGVFFWGNGRGVDEGRWRPSGSGAGWTPSALLDPLKDVKDYVSVVSGMTARMPDSPQGHHNGSAGILSGYDFIAQDASNAPYRSTFSRPSIDQLVAASMGTQVAFKSLEIGISRSVIDGEGTTIQYISHNGPDSPNPPEINPRALFDRVFAGFTAPPPTGTPGVGDVLRKLKKSVLDTVLGDLAALNKRVGKADRARLDQHAEAIRAIERRLGNDGTGGPSPLQCTDPTAPGEFEGEWGQEPLEERMGAMGDLLTLALSCDLTRSFSIQFSGSAAGPVFWQVGADRTHHDLSHDGEDAQDIIEACTIFTMQQLAGLLAKFRDTPDGTGNLLDSLGLIATSDCSDGAAHSVNDYPIVIAGRAGGALVHPGIHLEAEREHTNRVLLTLLRAVGVSVAELGDEDAHQTEGLAALEA
jgi:hypothetical protein